MAQLGYVSTVHHGYPCEPWDEFCANVTPHWGDPTDQWQALAFGTYKVEIDSILFDDNEAICLLVGTAQGSAAFGEGCGDVVTFTIPVQQFDTNEAYMTYWRVTVTMRTLNGGPAFVRGLTYSPV